MTVLFILFCVHLSAFCSDDDVAAAIQSVMDQYNDTEIIAQALNYYINRPDWAYLVYKV